MRHADTASSPKIAQWEILQAFPRPIRVLTPRNFGGFLVHVHISRFSIIVNSTFGPGANIEANLGSYCSFDVCCDIQGCLESNIIKTLVGPNVWSC